MAGVERLGDREIYAMMQDAGEHFDEFHFRVWRDSVDPHERVRYFNFYLHRRFGRYMFQDLDLTSTWWFMNEREKAAYNQLCDEREAYCERLAAQKKEGA